jgi:predicted HAD superfamily Cof-like phosphohydrolase
MSNFIDVWMMYAKFGLMTNKNAGIPQLIDEETAAFRTLALREELSELEEGYVEKDLPKIADALVDLVVFALGTAALHNLPWEELFEDVMRANNSKVPQFTDKKERNGAGSIDLIKPEGWRGPDTENILKDWGWE